MKDKVLEWLNWALVANLFLVLASFSWLAIAVVGHTFHLPLGLNLWYALWQPVFLPALGILMAGAILSGVINWVSNRFSQNQPG
jgi:TRAP-type C4-dicarboxylate transport system permease small subunit